MDQRSPRSLELEELHRKYPHLEDFKRCQKMAHQRAYMTFILASGGLFTVSFLLDKRKMLPYSRVHMLWVPIVIGSIASYTVGRFGTKSCFNRWMAQEGNIESLDLLLKQEKSYEYKEMEDCK